MKSATYEYRIITAPNNEFKFERRSLKNPEYGWTTFWSVYPTIEKAKQAVADMIAGDDFIPTVVDVL
jgi:hypothetical protein